MLLGLADLSWGDVPEACFFAGTSWSRTGNWLLSTC